jgi:HD superfamily phosphohydrolase YqeK
MRIFPRRHEQRDTQHKPRHTMTKNEFHNLCSMLYIETSLALENERVLEALRNHESYDEIAQILTEEF